MALIILGAGYVGKRLAALHPSALTTHRTPQPGSTVFELTQPATWDELRYAGADVVWTFPPQPVDFVSRFWESKLQGVRSLIVFGSTSGIAAAQPDASLGDDAPLDLTQPRVQGEEWLREHGATVLRLAGIFGPDREPLRWLQKGLIKNGAKLVNLIHVDDICAAVEALVAAPRPGAHIVAANGYPVRWRDLVAEFRARGLLPADFTLPDVPPGTDSKTLDNAALRALLPGRAFRRP